MAMLGAATTAVAEDGEEDSGNEIIAGAWSNPSGCNAENAQSVAFTTFTSDFQQLLGECVALEGYWSGRALFNIAKDAQSDRSNTVRGLQGKRVGLYAQWDLIGDPPEKPLRYRFVGIVGDCDTQWPGAIMVMGYCHYTSGPILLVSEAFSTANVR